MINILSSKKYEYLKQNILKQGDCYNESVFELYDIASTLAREQFMIYLKL